MAERSDLQLWVLRALADLGGHGTIVQVARYIWDAHEDDLRDSDDLFFTWQYDLRWAAYRLRKSGHLVPVGGRRDQDWTLSEAGWEAARASTLEDE